MEFELTLKIRAQRKKRAFATNTIAEQWAKFPQRQTKAANR